MSLSDRKIYRGNMDEGGSITFNAPGTWVTPTRLLRVDVQGRGGSGASGNSGTAGQGFAGNQGTLGTVISNGGAGNPGNDGIPGGGGGGGGWRSRSV